jgi:hypothetical protein
MFPNYIIPMLRDMRGPEWRDLVDRVMELPDDHPELLAFVLMMIRVDGCEECETDSYRAMRGCGMCAAQMLRRYKDPDSKLIEGYNIALADVQAYLVEQEEAARRAA